MTEYVWEAGQEVFEPSRGWGGNPGRKLVIERVTPSGRAQIGPYKYDKSGRRVGDRYACNIRPFTAEDAADILLFTRQVRAASLADKVRFRDLTAEQLDIILPALERISK